jgi:hygromycin-B 7''-O-kinase
MTELPEEITPAEFDSGVATGPIHEALMVAARQLARHHRLAGEVVHLHGGANFVAAVGPWNVIKLFPPFQRFQWEAEARVLKALIGQNLPIAVPEFRGEGELGHWPYVVMSRLEGTELESLLWPSLSETTRCDLLTGIGEMMRALHSLPAKILPSLDPPWDLFWAHQRQHCCERHRRQGLPEHLLAALPAWIDAHVPELAEFGPRVLLTGEYTPQNLLVRPIGASGWQLAGMFDFADSMIGPAHYDWLGPICFLVQGQRPRLEAFLRGYGTALGDEASWRIEQLNFLLLHRYSNPRLQLRIPGWEQTKDFEQLARMLWPEGRDQ